MARNAPLALSRGNMVRGLLNQHSLATRSASLIRLRLPRVSQQHRRPPQSHTFISSSLQQSWDLGEPQKSPTHHRSSTSEVKNAGVSAPTSPLNIIFTDIVSSSYLWERHPDAMKYAMQTHDSLLRRYMTVHNGYEVKQNGDGFMIAFQEAVDALAFCLDVQCELVEPEEGWPEELLQDRGDGSADSSGHVDCPPGEAAELYASAEGDSVSPAKDSANRTLIFRGLRLRMSLHHGDVVYQHNPVTDRADYLGPMVNRAARYIQATEPGQIVVSEAFLHALERQNDKEGEKGGSKSLIPAIPGTDGAEQFVVGDLLSLRGGDEAPHTGEKNLQQEDTSTSLRAHPSRFEVRNLGKRKFKGIQGRHHLYYIVPEKLKGRLRFWPGGTQVAGSKGNMIGGGSRQGRMWLSSWAL